MSSKGVIAAFVGAGGAIILIAGAILLIFIFTLYNSKEITISDKIADGLSSINYYYLTEKNINEFAQIVTEITAKELGEACGGFDCYSWSATVPSYQDLRDKFESELRGKITGFPKNIGNLGRLNFAPPKIKGLEMDENHVKISLDAQQVYRKTDSFFVNASSESGLEIDKQIRYLLLAKIGQMLYGNGTYAREWSKVFVNSGTFDCDGDGAAEKTISGKKLSEAGVNGCKIFSIDFDVDDRNADGNSKWSGMGDYCKGKQTTIYEPGVYAGKVESNKLYVQIDNLLEYSLICGIESTDGLASVVDTKGEVSKSGKSQVSCDVKEAGADAWQKAGLTGNQGKIQKILDALAASLSPAYPGIYIQSSAQIGSAGSYEAADTQNGWDVPCGNRQPGGCPFASCADRFPDLLQPTANIPQYCRSGDVCTKESSLLAKSDPSSDCCNVCNKCGRRRYVVSGEPGYCCPKEYPVFDSYTKTCGSGSEENLKIEVVNKIPPLGSRNACDCAYKDVSSSYSDIDPKPDTNGDCSWSYSNERTKKGYSFSCDYNGNANSGYEIISAYYGDSSSSNCGLVEKKFDPVVRKWENGIFAEQETYGYTPCSKDAGEYDYTYSCKLGAYFKFTFTPDISFKIIDSTLKVVKKGGAVGGETPRFEDLYMAVKFKPQQSYQIGPDSSAPPKPAQGTPHAPAAAQESKIIITAEGKDITI